MMRRVSQAGTTPPADEASRTNDTSNAFFQYGANARSARFSMIQSSLSDWASSRIRQRLPPPMPPEPPPQPTPPIGMPTVLSRLFI